MGYIDLIKHIYDKKISIGIQIILTLLTYLLVKYRYRNSSSYIALSKSTKDRLIRLFNPEPIVTSTEVPYKFDKVVYNFSSYDVFNLARKYKQEIKSTIREYGVGTCGPRGFYGTLDLHLDLENKLAKLFEKDAAILYSNYFTCVQSVIPCFCKSRNNLFVHSRASEAIKSGVLLCRSVLHQYDSIEDLKNKLDKSIRDKFVIVEKVGKNTGEVVNLEMLVKLKKEYGFRIILDVAYEIPFMYQMPEDRSVYSEIDLIIGSLCLGYPTNGGFCIGTGDAIEYQSLSGAAYVFSASLPAFLCKSALCMIEEKIDYSKIRQKIKIAHQHIPGIISDERTPVLLVECEGIEDKLNRIRNEGYLVGRCGEYLRICVNEESEENHLKHIGDIIRMK